VLHSVPDENAQRTVIHAHRDFNAHLAKRHGEQRPHFAVEAQVLGGSLEIVINDFSGILARVNSGKFHFHWPFDEWDRWRAGRAPVAESPAQDDSLDLHFAP